MERVFLSVGQMNPRLVPCNDCNTYRKAQGFSHPCCHHANEAQCNLAHVRATRTTGVKDNIRNDCPHALQRIDVYLQIGRKALRLPVLVVL